MESLAPSSEPKWRGSLQVLMGLGLAALFFFMLAPFLVSFFLAAVFAILCHPLHSRLTKKMPAWTSGLLITFGLLVGILAPFVTFLVGGSYQLIGFIGKLHLPTGEEAPEVLLRHPWLKQLVESIQSIMPTDKEWLKDQTVQIVQVTLQKTSALLGHTLSNVPSLLLGAVILIISFYFFLADGDRLLRFLSNLSPMKYERTQELFLSFESSCRGVVLGLFASAAVQGILIFIFALATGVPHPLLWGLATSVLSMVPLFGSTPISVGCTAYLFIAGHPVAGTIMGIGAVIAGLSDNVVRPMMLKGEAEMHPLLALVSVFGALNLFGAPGIFLGPIIAAVFVSFLKIMVQELKKEKGTAIAST